MRGALVTKIRALRKLIWPIEKKEVKTHLASRDAHVGVRRQLSWPVGCNNWGASRSIPARAGTW